MGRFKISEALQPGDEVLKAPGQVVTVTRASSISASDVTVHTDGGDFVGPRFTEVAVVAEGPGGD